MPKLDASDYLPFHMYDEALNALYGISGSLLFHLARSQVLRDIIVRNFIARAITMARSIFRLWQAEDYQDCWVLHRALLDRLFHLVHVHRGSQFEAFDDWSFLQQWNANHRVRSDPELGEARKGPMFRSDPDQDARAARLTAAKVNWRRPKAEEVAKDLGLTLLYRFGYDYASMHVHPMANDGYQDFHTITKLAPAPDFPDQRSVLSNTLLVVTMIVQEGLNASTLSWRKIVYDFLDQVRESLDAGAEEYKVTFVKLGRFLQEGGWLGQTTDPTAGDTMPKPS